MTTHTPGNEHNDGRESLAQELRGVLHARGLWCPENPADLISAIAKAIDDARASAAAAPDLLAAAERALGLLELSGSGKLAQTPAADDLRAAIAKARGKE